ncbi:MAG: DUF4149 domain-containing protein [bacterium]
MVLPLSMTVLSLLLGGMIYVTALVAPIIFMVLDDPEATQFTRKLWPRYFILNAVIALCAGIALLGWTWEFFSGLITLLVAVFMLVNWLCALWMRSLRDPGSDYEEGTTYDWLHSITVWTNGLSIVLILGIQVDYFFLG